MTLLLQNRDRCLDWSSTLDFVSLCESSRYMHDYYMYTDNNIIIILLILNNAFSYLLVLYF